MQAPHIESGKTMKITNRMEIIRAVSSIENQYCAFCKQHNYDAANNTVEYLGFNLSGELFAPHIFKLYYTTAQSLRYSHPFVEELRKRDMIRALNHISDSINIDCNRYEIGLAHRTNENMDWLFTRLAQIFPVGIDGVYHVVEALSELRITDDANYCKAAMFFLGFIEQSPEGGMFRVDTLKLHYLLRRCLYPDRIGNNFTVDNVVSLQQLESSKIDAFTQLVSVVRPITMLPGVEVWMAAIDFSLLAKQKYKIYLKGCSLHGYESLSKELAHCGSRLLAQQVLGYERWAAMHPELEQYGLAVCLDSSQQMTVNFYH